jgi:hypothetical protein
VGAVHKSSCVLLPNSSLYALIFATANDSTISTQPRQPGKCHPSSHLYAFCEEDLLTRQNHAFEPSFTLRPFVATFLGVLHHQICLQCLLCCTQEEEQISRCAPLMSLALVGDEIFIDAITLHRRSQHSGMSTPFPSTNHSSTAMMCFDDSFAIGVLRQPRWNSNAFSLSVPDLVPFGHCLLRQVLRDRLSEKAYIPSPFASCHDMRSLTDSFSQT